MHGHQNKTREAKTTEMPKEYVRSRHVTRESMNEAFKKLAGDSVMHYSSAVANVD